MEPPEIETVAPDTTTTQSELDYVVNINSGKFHEPSCSSAASIASYNRWDYHGTREELIDKGYVPCKAQKTSCTSSYALAGYKK